MVRGGEGQGRGAHQRSGAITNFTVDAATRGSPSGRCPQETGPLWSRGRGGEERDGAEAGDIIRGQGRGGDERGETEGEGE